MFLEGREEGNPVLELLYEEASIAAAENGVPDAPDCDVETWMDSWVLSELARLKNTAISEANENNDNR